MECIPISQLIVRDSVRDSVQSNAIDVVDCILHTGCRFWQDDDNSAQQIGDCLVLCMSGVSEWTADEFEYAVRVVCFFCAVKFAHVYDMLENKDGDIDIPNDWIEQFKN